MEREPQTGVGGVDAFPIKPCMFRSMDSGANWTLQDGANIVTEWSAARVKLTRTYASSADGKVLTVRVAPEEKKGGPPPRPPMTLIYDRE